MYSIDKIDKIGNTIVYLATNIPNISKTKLLKLIYLLDEISIRKFGIPFLNLEYKVWKFGPVASDIFVELSSAPSMLKPFIDRGFLENGHDYISASKPFSDDEFTANDIELLEFVVYKFKDISAAELIELTHRKESPWYNAALKHGKLEDLKNEVISSTDIVINMKELIQHDEQKKAIYEDYLEYY
jgi:uncharacterized phage-associated protein